MEYTILKKIAFICMLAIMLSACGGGSKNNNYDYSSVPGNISSSAPESVRSSFPASISNSSSSEPSYTLIGQIAGVDRLAGIALDDKTFILSGGNSQTCCMGNFATSNQITIYSIDESKTLNIVTTTQMKVSRGEHNLTQLPSGNVFIQGGFNEARGNITDPGYYNDDLRELEIFNKSTNTTALIGNLPSKRFANQNIVDGNGNIVMLGGSSTTKFGDIYNEQNAELAKTAGEMKDYRAYFSIEKLSDGRFLLIGGLDETQNKELSSMEIYDPANQTFREAPISLLTPRFKQRTLTLSDGSILVVGGISNNTYNHTVEIINPNDWSVKSLTVSYDTNDSTIPADGELRYYQDSAIAMSQLSTNYILILGLKDSLLLDLDKQTLAPISEPIDYVNNGPYYHREAFKLSSNKLIITGGRGLTMYSSTSMLLFE